MSTSPQTGAGGSKPADWASLKRSNMPKSPDAKVKSAGMQILGTVGVIEFLELDERPTFLIDLANPTNFIPGGSL